MELEELRKQKIFRLEEDVKILRKCLDMCTTAIMLNEDTLENLGKKQKEMEKTEEKKDDIDRMFN